MSTATDPALPPTIGPFPILRLLGEGGMGRVYLAEQDAPRREVALKVLCATAGSEAQQRFEREAALLAALEHPGIARIYASGSADTPSGPLPYLAMEYIRGRDLISHALEHDLSQPARLRLLAAVCRAVHHAHTQGVIHRDLKPANILVDEQGQPRILDFSVARAIGHEQFTRMTAAGEILGTLQYMSSEQLVGDARIDARSDVYALGAVGYELLAGAPPYPGLAQTTLLGAIELVRSSDPPRLSRAAPTAAGDVETIIMKALAREPAHRYGSAAELAVDIERHLAHQPIAARPPTARYLLGLFVRRHRALSAAAGLIAVALVAATAVSLRFAWSEARAGGESEARERLEAWLPQLVGAAPATQRLRLAAETELTEVLILQGFPEQAEAQLRQTVPEAEAVLGVQDDIALQAGYNLALALHHLTRYDESTAQVQQVIERLQARFGGEHPRVQLARDVMALNYREQARYAEAEAIYRQTVATRQRVLGDDHPQTRAAEVSLAAILALDGRAKEAAAVARTAHESLRRQLGEDAELTRNVASLRAYTVSETGAWDEAAQIYRDLIAQAEAHAGGPTVTDLPDYNNLGNALKKLGRHAESVEVFETLLKHAGTLVGPDHLHHALFQMNYADGLVQLGRTAPARAAYEQAIPVLRRDLGAEHPRTQRAVDALAALSTL